MSKRKKNKQEKSVLTSSGRNVLTVYKNGDNYQLNVAKGVSTYDLKGVIQLFLLELGDAQNREVEIMQFIQTLQIMSNYVKDKKQAIESHLQNL